MRIVLTLFPVVTLALLCLAADPPKAPDTTKLIIINDGGVTLSPTNVVFRDNVRVFESDMYMECELLTLLQQTNNSTPAGPPGSLTNFNAQVDTITAETNLMIMARGTTVLGDRAVYTRSNESFAVTGNLVVIERSNLLFFATNFVFNRLTSSGHAVGWTATEVELSGSGTNAPKAGFGTRLRPNPAPAQPRTDGPPK